VEGRGAWEGPVKRARRRSASRHVQERSRTKRQPARFAWQIIAVSVVALIVRLLYISEIHRSPFFDVLTGDARRYDSWAAQIAAGDWIGRDVFYQAPLYPYFLGTLYAIAGRSLLTVRVCQAFIGAAACALLALAARRLYSERVGLIAGLGLALYAPAIFFDGLLQKSALDLFFVSLSLWLISGLVDDPATRWRWLWVGIAMGGLALTRENGLIFVAPILLWSLGRSRLEQRQRMLNVGVFVLGLTLVLLPVAARNGIVGGEWYLTTSQFGPNLYIGNNADAEGTYSPLREGRGSPEFERQDATELAEAATGRRLTAREVSSFWMRRAIDFVRSHPGAWLKLMGGKVALLWNRTEWLDTESQESYEEWSPLLRTAARAGHFGILVPLAVLGVFVTWRDRARVAVYYLMALTYAASVVMFYVSARYRLPLVPFLILFAAAGLSSLPAFVRTASGTKVAAVAVIVGAVAILTNRPLLSADLMRAITENNLGGALQADQRFQEAETHYRRALALQPDYAPAYVNLGTALVAQHRPDEAIEAYKRAIQLESADVDLDSKLGNALLQAGKPADAIVHFRRAIAAGGRSAEIYNNLGVALIDTNREDEAIVAYKESLQLNPNNGVLRFTLGTLLLKRENFAEAIDEFRAGLALVPDSPEAHNNLGNALASSGRTAEAIAEFEHALRLNPNLESARRNLALARPRAKTSR
jgi:tetratricopeptide (TPR) repeat protein